MSACARAVCALPCLPWVPVPCFLAHAPRCKSGRFDDGKARDNCTACPSGTHSKVGATVCSGCNGGKQPVVGKGCVDCTALWARQQDS